MKNFKIQPIRQHDQYEVAIVVQDLNSAQCEILSFRHTNHSRTRASQRGVTLDKVALVLTYGQSFFRQGLIFYVLGEKDIPQTLSKHSNKLKNTVVVVAANSDEIITCYRSKNAFRNIRLKNKSICTNSRAAA